MRFLIGLFFMWFCFLPRAWAYVYALPRDLPSAAVSESVPTALAPADWDTRDFSLIWKGSPPEGTEVQLIRGSLEWVRVADFLVVPRARLRVVSGAKAGRITTAGFSQTLSAENGGRVAVIPVALVSGESNPIDIVLVRGEKETHFRLEARFTPRPGTARDHVFVDPSCSPYGVEAEGVKSFEEKWAYIGCRLGVVEGSDHRTSSLEILVLWDRGKDSLEIDGVATPPAIGSVWALRQRSQPGRIRLKDGNHELTLKYSAPENLHHLSLGVGVGPYSYSFFGPDEARSTYSPIFTLYGSYFITEMTRMVAFDATAINNRLYTDFGLYLNSESVRTLDRRVAVNILLGAHLVGFKAAGNYHLRIGAPQGFEFVYFDALARANSLSVGAFIFPPINGKSYNNIWLRWGSSSVFGELNYISSEETIDDILYYQRSFGFSMGFPLGKLF